MGKVLDISLPAYNEIMKDGDHESSHSAPQERWIDLANGEEWYTIPMWIEDKTNHKLVEVWIWLRDYNPTGSSKPLGHDHHPPTTGGLYNPGEFAMLEVRDSNGNVTATLNGMATDPDEFMENLSEDKPSDERYAYWVSLLDDDVTINASKYDDDLEVGANGGATVNAGNGDDLLSVWHQKNVIYNGGKGADMISFAAHSSGTPAAMAGAIVNLGAGTGTNPFGGTMTFSKVENASGVSDKANTLIGSAQANQLNAGHQADTINGLGGDDSVTIVENNTFGARAMSVDGGTGDDTLFAYMSSVEHFTGSGQTLRHGNVLDLLDPSNNTGTFNGGAFVGFETYRATSSDGLTGKYYGFDFRGSNNGETAIGISGRDDLQGRGGNDTLRGGEGADTLDGGDGRDVADYSDNNFFKIVAKINGASTTITVNGVQQDTFISIEGAKGGNANDKLTGDGGANEFDGSLGKDTLTGKGGKDHFVFSTELGGTNVDTLKDFKPGADKIDLDATIFAKLGPDISKGEFLKVSSGHAAKQSDDRLIYNKTDGTLWFDDDGTGKHAAVKFAVLTGSPDTISFHDFHIV